MLLPCAATCPSVVARAAVARGAIAGASALLSSWPARGDSVVQGRDGGGVVAGGCRVHRQVSHLSVGSQSEGQLSCCDARAVSHLSVVQDLRDVARDRSFKHVFLGVVVTRIRNDGVLYFRNAPTLESLWHIRGQGGIIIYHLATAPTSTRSGAVSYKIGHRA